MRKSVPMLLAFFLSCILLTGCAKKEEVTPPSVTEGVITGKVEAGGKPLAGVEVSVPGLGISVETGSDGSFKLTGLMEGAWEVVFKKEGYVASPVTVTLSSGEKKDIGTISMTQTGSISGVVTIQGETSFGGVSVSIKELPEIPPVKTKDDGSFVIANVPPGSYTLVAEKVGYSPVQATIEVEEGKVFEIELVIKAKAKLEVKLISVGSGRNYQIVENLKAGDTYYIDRAYTITTLPQGFESKNLIWIKTANDDKASTGLDFLVFEVNVPVVVWLIHDKRVAVTTWMTDLKFQKTDLTMDVTDTGASPLEVFKAEFPAGKISLGGNEGGGNSMYVVAIEAK